MVPKKSKRGSGLEPPLDPYGHEAFKTRLREEHRSAKARIDEGISKLVAAFQAYDPFPVIAELSVQNCFIDPETYSEPIEERSEALVEYAQSVALAVPEPGTKNPTTEWVDDCCDLIREIFESTEFYFLSEFAEEGFEAKYPGVEAEVRMLTVMRTLKMRGDSVQEHHEDLFLGLFESHDDFLRKHFGFSATELLAATYAIDEQLAERVQVYLSAYAARLRDLDTAFRHFAAEKGESPDTADPDRAQKLSEEFFGSAAAAPFNATQRAARERVADLFFIEPSARVSLNVLDFLSADLRMNREFIEGKGKAWPLGESVIRQKPVVRGGGRTYAFNPLLLSRFLIDAMEGAIREADRIYFDERYLPKRGKYLEEKAIEHLVSMLPRAVVYRNLEYEITENGQRKQVETDALVIFDHCLFIVECKAGGVTAAAHRGAMVRIKGHMEALIADAAKQGFRTRDYVGANSPAQFVDETGTAITIPNLLTFDDVFVITPTLTPLAHFATRLATVRQLADLPIGAWSWSVFLNDLRIASELFESPAEFVLYLRRRLLINETANIATTDELDLVMYFLKHGMFFGDNSSGETNPMVLHGYTVDLDRYHSFLGGRASTGEKPRFNISDEMRGFVARIEASGAEHRTYAAAAFLALDSPTQRRVLDDVSGLRRKMTEDGEDHTLTMSAGVVGYAVSIIPKANADQNLKRLRSYDRTKKHQWKKDAWVHVCLIVAPDGTDRLELFVDTQPWTENRELDERVSHFQRQKVAQALATRKIGRNELCPCNSGRKFKQCCGA